MNKLKLNKCKNIKDLRRYVIDEVEPTKGDFNFKAYFLRATDENNIRKLNFQEAFIKVWNYELQKENPSYLGKERVVRFKRTAIRGMEVSGH